MWEKSNSSNNACGEDSSWGAQTSRRSTSSTWCTLMHDFDMKSNKSEKLIKHHNSNKENEDNRKVLLDITVEIEDRCSGHIEMKEGDSAEGVATTFCHDYFLPDDFVAPLTEHILNNIIRICKKDKNIIFCSTEERDAYEAWLKQGNYPDENDSRKSSGCQYQDSKSRTPLAQSQLVNRPPPLSLRTLLKTRSMLAQQMQSCRCPCHLSRSKPFKGENRRRRRRRMSDIAKVGCLRLYNDSLDRRLRHVQMWRQNVRQFSEKVNRTKIQGPKKSWRVYKTRSEIAQRYRNYGELLYTEGLIMKEKLLVKMQRKKREDEELEMAGFTGKPKITPKAKHMRRPKGDVWHKLAAQRYNFDHIRDEMTEARMAECTFTPHINHSPNEPTNASMSRFDQLYCDSESRRRRQQEYADWYQEGVTFQPAINRRSNEKCQVSVFDRLTQSHEKKATIRTQSPRRWQEKEATHRVRIDGKTQTGRKPQCSPRNPKNLPVKIYLRELQVARQRKKEAMVNKAKQQTVREQTKSNYVNTPDQSLTLLTRLKPRALKQIFDFLDTNKDGFIQLCEVDTSYVSIVAAQDINTLIRLGKGNQRLSFDAFQALVQKIEEKGSIVNHVDTSDMKFEYKVPGDILEKRQQEIDALRKPRALKQIFDALDTNKDGFIQLSEVDTSTVSIAAAQDINTLIKLGQGNQRLLFDDFQALVQKIEEYKVLGGLSSDHANKRQNYSTSDELYNILEKRQQEVDASRKERRTIEMQIGKELSRSITPEFLAKPRFRV